MNDLMILRREDLCKPSKDKEISMIQDTDFAACVDPMRKAMNVVFIDDELKLYKLIKNRDGYFANNMTASLEHLHNVFIPSLTESKELKLYRELGAIAKKYNIVIIGSSFSIMVPNDDFNVEPIVQRHTEDTCIVVGATRSTAPTTYLQPKWKGRNY